MSPNLFIFGPERSGTTLLSFLISGQPNSFVINDSFIYDRFIKDFLYNQNTEKYFSYTKAIKYWNLFLYIIKKGLPRDFSKNPAILPYIEHKDKFGKFDFEQNLERKEALNFLYLLKNFYKNRKDRWLNQYAEFIKPEKIINENESVKVKNLIDNTISMFCNSYKNERLQLVGEKTPIHTLYGNELLKKYIKAKGLLLIKNPIDNINSIYRRCNNFNESLKRFRQYQSAILELKDNEKVYTLIYDDLIADTYASVRNIYDYIDLNNIEIDKNLPVYNYIKGSYTGNNIDADRLIKTKNILTNKQKQIVYSNFQNLFKAFDFELK
jgi:hypothetical protein